MTGRQKAPGIRLGETDLELIASRLAEAVLSVAQEAIQGHSAFPEPGRTTLELASDVLKEPASWLRTPNPQLGDRAPIDLIGTDEEFKVYNLLNAVDQGLF